MARSTGPQGGGTLDAPVLVTPVTLRAWGLPEPAGSKYDRGQVVVVGGACKTPGAAMLAGLAALRMGAGRLSLAVADSVAPHVAVAVPESGVYGLDESADGSITGEGAATLLDKEVSRANGLLIGPGLDHAEGTIRLIEELTPLVDDEVCVVLDAFGVTVLPDVSAACRGRLAGRMLLTPNTNELAKLIGADEIEDDEVAEAAYDVAQRYDATVTCNSWVVSGSEVWRITTGDTGLATSGSGDVLAGAVAGLVTRGADGPQAMVWAAYAHAAAGDGLATKFGRVGFLAGELPAQLPLVLRSLRGD